MLAQSSLGLVLLSGPSALRQQGRSGSQSSQCKPRGAKTLKIRGSTFGVVVPWINLLSALEPLILCSYSYLPESVLFCNALQILP